MQEKNIMHIFDYSFFIRTLHTKIHQHPILSRNFVIRYIISLLIGWCRYEDDPIIGHRLYREIRKAEVKKAKTKGSQVLPNALYQWETVATNLDEFEDVSVSL